MLAMLRVEDVGIELGNEFGGNLILLGAIDSNNLSRGAWRNLERELAAVDGIHRNHNGTRACLLTIGVGDSKSCRLFTLGHLDGCKVAVEALEFNLVAIGVHQVDSELTLICLIGADLILCRYLIAAGHRDLQMVEDNGVYLYGTSST